VDIIVPVHNEEASVDEFHGRLARLGYADGLIVIDNASTDGTLAKCRALAARDPNFKVIVNTRNFGQIRSPYHAVLQARGDAIIGLAADLQDPPSLIPEFLARWEEGYKVALAVKRSGEERWPMSAIRRLYYDLLAHTTSVETIKGATGFGLYDRQVIEIIRGMNEMYPYFRGLVAEIGFPVAQIPYDKPLRKRGFTKNNLLTLFDVPGAFACGPSMIDGFNVFEAINAHQIVGRKMNPTRAENALTRSPETLPPCLIHAMRDAESEAFEP